MTMGLAKVSRNEWIEIDSKYRTQIIERTNILESHSEQTLGTTPAADHIVSELYREIIFQQLPQRFPTVFSLSADKRTINNNITGLSFPSKPLTKKTDHGISSLRILAVNIVEDLFVLRPDIKSGKHLLCAFVACYPNGFETAKLMDKSVSEIHAPVPLYKEKLEMSVDRFFKTIKVGDFMRRFNWSITTCGPQLFTPKNLNNYPGHTSANDEQSELAIEDVYLRVERQILTRLPQSRAVVFTVKTYMTPLTDVRVEGSGPQLLAAVKAWPKKVAFYKRRPYWFNQVCEYLEEAKTGPCADKTENGNRDTV
ncbi:hypothetical protein JMJ35_006448 [Cladonia borealis]|uniref:Uncharacterized protein n=1 Tax=Cladonia borealis TaxID=184061 RepID=A0AA39U904_9LECA|nr:hypothetical protein JMJ35_006448 [Cladonia borealis]